MKESLKLTFWALVIVFIFILVQFFVPPVMDLFRGTIFLIPLIIFCLLGIGLIVLTIRQKIKGKLKKFLLLTGISAAGFFVCVFLHNGFYALGIICEQIVVLRYLMEALHIIFFLAAIFACPLGFLIGLVGSVTLFIKRKV